MLNNNQNIICPTLEEIFAASKPDAAISQRDAIRLKLYDCKTEDEALLGVIRFLKDHNYDFDELYLFLDTSFIQNKSVKTNIISFKSLSIAASILVILVSIWYFNIRETPLKIITKSIFHEPGLPVFASIVGDKTFHEMMSSYRINDSKIGLNYYHLLIENNPQNDTLNYFGGWLYYQNGKNDSAAMAFNKVIKSKSTEYIYKAQFMQAVCVYITGNKQSARKLLDSISKDKLNPYNQKSIELLSNTTIW